MSIFKIERDLGQSFLVIQGQKGQQISEREYYAINSGQIKGLLHATVLWKSKSFKLRYNISGYISLKEFLVNPLNKTTFAKLLNNILVNLKSLQKAYFNYQFILMDINAAMVNPATQEVNFVYVPITFYESGTSLKDFLLSIIQNCSFVSGERNDYVRDYVKILNSGINFSIFELEEYINGLNGGYKSSESGKRCTKCGFALLPNDNFCPACGLKANIINVENPQNVYDPLINFSVPSNNDINSISTCSFADNKNEEVYDSFFECDHQKMNYEKIRNKAYLVRLSNGEEIFISVYPFKIGKDSVNNQYCISNNSAVSRCHLEIQCLNNRWYVVDLKSTNKTYVEGQSIPPYVPVEIFNGTNIKVANEAFKFVIY